MIYLYSTTTITYMQQEDNKLLKKFGKYVKKLRLERSKSLNAFAFEKGGITSATLSRIENGLVDLKFSTLVKLSIIFRNTVG